MGSPQTSSGFIPIWGPTYTPEELHRLTGCCRFRNYQHKISSTKDGVLLNTGEFPLSLGTYATIPKAPRGKAIDRLPAKYLNIVHVDIAFGDCISIGGYKFALIFVDRATRYNWTFGLNPSNTTTFNPHFLPFKTRPALSPVRSDVTATRSCSAALYAPSSMATTLPSRPARPVVSLRTGWSNHIGK